MDEYCKCRFCKYYDSFCGCVAMGCYEHKEYKPNKKKIIEKSQETGLSVADVIALINMED